jgi:hypothetical protein
VKSDLLLHRVLLNLVSNAVNTHPPQDRCLWPAGVDARRAHIWVRVQRRRHCTRAPRVNFLSFSGDESERVQQRIGLGFERVSAPCQLLNRSRSRRLNEQGSRFVVEFPGAGF